MTREAHAPQELDPLLEDAFVVGDRALFGVLFADGAVVANGSAGEARGDAIGRVLAELSANGRTYVAGAQRVLRSGDTALVVADAAIHVLQRGAGGTWRSAISVLETVESTRSEET